MKDYIYMDLFNHVIMGDFMEEKERDTFINLVRSFNKENIDIYKLAKMHLKNLYFDDTYPVSEQNKNKNKNKN